MDEVLNAVNAIFTEHARDDSVVSKWYSASVDLTVAPLVDKFGNGVLGWVTESDEWLDDTDHVPCGFVQLDKHTVMQLSESKKLEDLLGLWSKLIDTKEMRIFD